MNIIFDELRQRKLLVPRTHNKLGDRSFSAAGPRLWNGLRRPGLSFDSFRRSLKTHLFWQLKRLVTLSTCRRYINKCIHLSIYLHQELRDSTQRSGLRCGGELPWRPPSLCGSAFMVLLVHICKKSDVPGNPWLHSASAGCRPLSISCLQTVTAQRSSLRGPFDCMEQSTVCSAWQQLITKHVWAEVKNVSFLYRVNDWRTPPGTASLWLCLLWFLVAACKWRSCLQRLSVQYGSSEGRLISSGEWFT